LRRSVFSSSGDPRHLVPFPTRRSYDLGDGVLAAGPGVSGAFACAGGADLGDGAVDEHVEGVVGPRLAGGAARGKPRRGVGEALLDRKSTRLNSSHVKISYAVFCLKKKR